MLSDAARYPATWLQQSLYALAQGSTSVIKVPAAIRLRGPLDKGRLHEAMSALVVRHEALRTALAPSDGRLLQVVASACPELDIEEDAIDAEQLPDAYRAEFARPFDLRSGPLVRARLFRLAGDDHVLAFAADHTIMDGGSVQVVVRDLAALYAGKALQPPRQLSDHALWEQRDIDSMTSARRAFWEARLADVARPAQFVAQPGAECLSMLHALPDISLGAVLSQARRHRVSAMAVLGGLATVSLREWLDASRIVVGLFVGNRDGHGLRDTVGMIADLMPVPVDLHGAKDFGALVRGIAETIDDCYEHRVPLGAIRHLLEPRDHEPLFVATWNYLSRSRGGGIIKVVDGLELDGAIVESLDRTWIVPGWWDGFGLRDYRWRASSDRLTSHVVTNGGDQIDSGTSRYLLESLSALAADPAGAVVGMGQRGEV